MEYFVSSMIEHWSTEPKKEIKQDYTMRKYGLGLALYGIVTASAAMNSSTVLLPGGGVVNPAASVNIPLTGIIPSSTYDVVCYIDTTNPFMIVQLGVSLGGSTATVTAYTLNGDSMTQGQLKAGHNIALITGNFANPALANLVFTNLDQNYTFNVNNCFAMAKIV